MGRQNLGTQLEGLFSDITVELEAEDTMMEEIVASLLDGSTGAEPSAALGVWAKPASRRTTSGLIIVVAGILFVLAAVLQLPLPTRAAPPALPTRPTELPPRPPDATPVPPSDDDEDDEPIGAHIELHVEGASPHVWTVVQWQDSAGGWHDVEGWRGNFDEGNRKVWWVAWADFGTGPFRWVVYQTEGGTLLATSESFMLPQSAAEWMTIQVSLAR
jgi:hypothetical protein